MPVVHHERPAIILVHETDAVEVKLLPVFIPILTHGTIFRLKPLKEGLELGLDLLPCRIMDGLCHDRSSPTS